VRRGTLISWAKASAAALLAACALAAPTQLPAQLPPTLRVGVNGLPVSMGDPFRGNGRPGTLIWYALYDGLTQLNPKGQLVPSLALSWRATSPTVWRFTLRSGVRYANGRPFDAAAAAKVLNWLASPAARRTVVGNELRSLKSARAIGPLELEIVTARPDPILPKRLVAALMVEPDARARLGPDGFGRAPVGTGPYQLQSWDQRRRRVTLTRNPYSWRTVHYQRVQYIELPDAAVRTQALLSRDVDLAPVEIEELERLRRRGFTVLARSPMAVMSVGLRTERPTPGPLQDVRVRQALNYAVNKEAMARVLLHGLGRPSGQPAARGAFGHDPALKAYPYDPAKARRLLADAGYPKGFEMDIDVLINAWAADSLIFQAMQHDLRQVGVRANLRVVQLPAYLKNLQGNTWEADAFVASWNSAPYNDATRPMESFSCRRPKPFFCDKPLTARLAKASSIMDPAAREAAMRDVSAGFHEAAPAIFLVDQVDLWAHRPGLKSVELRNRIPIYEDIAPSGSGRPAP
jgi:peptide/nickel transport system substrate-binding protein